MQTIIHGNCLERLDTFAANTIDLILTDPPYGNNAAYYGRKTIAGDEHPLVACAALARTYKLLKHDRAAFVFTDAKHLPFMINFIDRYTGFRFKETIVWDKGRIGMGSGFRKSYELILALEKGKPQYQFKNVGNLVRFANLVNKEHPHEKPLPLLRLLIAHASGPGTTVLDPFAGSGSTLVAAALEDRNGIGIECSAEYVALAERRLWEVGKARRHADV